MAKSSKPAAAAPVAEKPAKPKSVPVVEPKVQKGPKLEHYQVVLAPLVSEKGTHLAERRNTYAFQVHQFATKPQIKAAVEHLFEVKVTQVRTQNRLGKRRRFKGYAGQESSWKKAYVTLAEQDRITLF